MTEERPRQLFRASVALLIEDGRGNLLMVQQAASEKGFGWGLPAGGVESNESPLQAAYREGEEELGVRVEITHLFRIYTIEREGRTREAFSFQFWTEPVPLESLRIPPNEILDARYLSYLEIMELDAKGELYKPRYNRRAIYDWRHNPVRFSLDVLSSFVPLSEQRPLIQEIGT